jgi:hypothetical protein
MVSECEDILKKGPRKRSKGRLDGHMVKTNLANGNVKVRARVH